MLVVLNATKIICNNDVTARLNLEESHQYSFRRISASDVIMTNLSPAAAVAYNYNPGGILYN